MDFKQIQELIKLVNDSNIGEVTLSKKILRLPYGKKKNRLRKWYRLAPSAPAYAFPQPAPQAAQAGLASGGTCSRTACRHLLPRNTITIKSPMIGTFYRRPSPDKPNFLEVGDEVTVGKVVCIIEAMKLFNEIESEVSGKVVKILVEDASPVEYDQPFTWWNLHLKMAKEI
jgi:acetyl-CoA carboxylase biotin carboxyl carrier protein